MEVKEITFKYPSNNQSGSISVKLINGWNVDYFDRASYLDMYPDRLADVIAVGL
jgi:hypothetical protein